MTFDTFMTVVGLVAVVFGLLNLGLAATWGPRIGWWKRVPAGRFQGYSPLAQGLVNVVLGLSLILQG